VVRVIGTITLVDFGMVVVSDSYYPAYSHSFANSSLGTIAMFWAMAKSLLLPVYVGAETWLMRKNETARAALLVDAVLAIACFLSLLGIVLYGFEHYAMF